MRRAILLLTVMMATLLLASGVALASRLVIDGTDADETFTGTDVVVSFFAKGGVDTVNARGGNDELYDEAGGDILNGENGDDTILGNSLVLYDHYHGGDTRYTNEEWAAAVGGNDTLNGGLGGDELQGEVGDDKLYGNDGLYGGGGVDTMLGD